MGFGGFLVGFWWVLVGFWWVFGGFLVGFGGFLVGFWWVFGGFWDVLDGFLGGLGEDAGVASGDWDKVLFSTAFWGWSCLLPCKWDLSSRVWNHGFSQWCPTTSRIKFN